jgi:hypothetical protein
VSANWTLGNVSVTHTAFHILDHGQQKFWLHKVETVQSVKSKKVKTATVMHANSFSFLEWMDALENRK